MINKKAYKKCQENGHHTWQDPKDWNINFDSFTDSTETFTGLFICNECGATCEVQGEWEK